MCQGVYPLDPYGAEWGEDRSCRVGAGTRPEKTDPCGIEGQPGTTGTMDQSRSAQEGKERPEDGTLEGGMMGHLERICVLISLYTRPNSVVLG